jgi:SNF2 family DNA or RNA helicase/ribosomal protein S24E
MLIFNYDETHKMIVCKDSDDSYYVQSRLANGIWKQSERASYYPLNMDNIERLFLYHKKDGSGWKLALTEKLAEYLNKRKKNIIATQFLTKLTIDKISDLPVLYSSKSELKLFKNQHIAQYWGRGTDSHAMLWEMGTGKTRSAIEIYEIKKKLGHVNHGIVLCPLSMVNKWIDEIGKWSTGLAYPIRGTKETKNETLSEDWEWLVTTFETFSIMKDDILKIVDDGWFCILDETTKIKNPRAKRSKACHELGLKTLHKLILTGTPVTQHAYDVFSQFLFLDAGETFGVNYDGFLDKYFWRSGFKLIAKRGTPEEISNKMFGKATRFLKKECIDIPDKLYDQRILELPLQNKLRYDEMVKWCITQIEGSDKVTAPIILTQLLRLSQITSGFVKDVSGKDIPFEKNPKIDALRDIFESTNGNKMVVWSRFQYDIEQIMQLCRDMEIGAVSLYGKDNEQQRWNNIKRFQTDSSCKVIAGTAGTGGHGIDLTSANTVIYFSNSYSLEQRLQSEDRVHRAGQVNSVLYIDLLCKDTIDIAIYKVLRSKKSIADIVTKDNIRGFL